MRLNHNGMEKGLIPVMLMSYTSDGQIDFDGLERLTAFYLEAGCSGLFTNCYSTEMYELTQKERILNARHIVSLANGRVPVVAVGTFAETTIENIELIKEMYDTGVNAVIIISSKIVKAEESDEVFMRRLEKIMAATEGIPLGIYECPFPYKRIMSPEIYKALLPHGRIKYHKDTSCDMNSVRAKLNLIKDSPIKFYEAHMPNALTSLQSGASGLSAIAGNYYPEVLSWLCKYYDDPYKQEDVRFMESEFARVDPLLHDAYHVAVKYFLQLRGVKIKLKSRRYNAPLTRQQERNLEELLETFYQWCDRLSIQVRQNINF